MVTYTDVILEIEDIVTDKKLIKLDAREWYAKLLIIKEIIKEYREGEDE